MGAMKRFLLGGLGLLTLALIGPATSARAESPPVFIRAWGAAGTGDGQFGGPQSLAVDQDGNVYVTDTGNDRIQKFDSNGTFLTKWGSHGSSPGQFYHPWGIAVDQGGNVYVTDVENHRVQKFDSNGGFIMAWGGMGSAPGRFYAPRGVAADQSGHVYVVDRGTGYGRAQKFDSAGGFIAAWETKGGYWPTSPDDIGVGPGGYVYVSDSFRNANVEVYDTAGGFLFAIGGLGTIHGGSGLFTSPDGIGIDASGNVYVADFTRNQVLKFESQGNLLTKWGSYGSGDGQFGACADVAVDAAGNVYVLDGGYQRVEKFRPGSGSVPTLPTSWGRVKAAYR